MEKLHALFFTPPIEANFLGHQMSEVYRDGVYAPFVEGRKGLTILDLGANVGVTAYYFSQFAKTVYAVEPSKEHFLALEEMISFNGLDNIKAINKAVYIKSGSLPLFHNQNKTMFSLNSAVAEPTLGTEVVECTTIKDLITDNKIDKVDFMKLDIEGSETEVISSPSFSDVAPIIDTIVVERHSWSGRHPNQLVDALKSAGYQVSQIPNQADLLVGQR